MTDSLTNALSGARADIEVALAQSRAVLARFERASVPGSAIEARIPSIQDAIAALVEAKAALGDDEVSAT